MPRCILCNHNDEMPETLSIEAEEADYWNPVAVPINGDEMRCLRCRELINSTVADFREEEED